MHGFTHCISQMKLVLLSQSSATHVYWFWGSRAKQWCVIGCPPAQLLKPNGTSLPHSHVPGVWKSVPDVQYFEGRSLSDPESIRKKLTLYVVSYCKFCIYTHPVNSKFTIWQLSVQSQYFVNSFSLQVRIDSPTAL